MNNEPVAWRKVVGNVTKHYQYNEIGEGTPLYTHPVKELTERIRKLETALQGWEIGFERMGYERLLKDKDEYIAELLKESAKELTEWEITEVIRKIANNNEYVYSLYEDFEGIEFSRVGIYELCRAILRKAQEK